MRAMDAFSDVLRVVRLTGGVFLDARFTAPWSLSGKVESTDFAPFRMSPSEVMPFHYVVGGNLLARVEDGPWVELSPGEIVMFPRNTPHVLASARDLTPFPSKNVVAEPAESGLFRINWGGGG